MSIEQLLLFLLLIALPLLERLVSAMRARRERSRAERLPAPALPPVLQPPAPVFGSGRGARVPETLETDLPLPGLPLPPTVPPAPRPSGRAPTGPGGAPVPLPASTRDPRRRRERQERPAPGVRARRADGPPALQRSIARSDLRRAIVLIAILGPCRALEPNDAVHLG
jgi:hypothetical protein